MGVKLLTSWVGVQAGLECHTESAADAVRHSEISKLGCPGQMEAGYPHTSNTEAKHQLRYCIHDDPSICCCPIGNCQHEASDKHDHSILKGSCVQQHVYADYQCEQATGVQKMTRPFHRVSKRKGKRVAPYVHSSAVFNDPLSLACVRHTRVGPCPYAELCSTHRSHFNIKRAK